MPPLHYAMCGCEKMPDYPKRWGGSNAPPSRQVSVPPGADLSRFRSDWIGARL